MKKSTLFKLALAAALLILPRRSSSKKPQHDD